MTPDLESLRALAESFNEDQRRLCERFARGRLNARRCAEPTDRGWAERWSPRVAARNVRNRDDPPHGFPTKAEALAAASRYREDCRALVPYFQHSESKADV